jgi:hypothetical protein
VVADDSTITHYPFAAVNMPARTPFKEGRTLLSHFLSSLCWVEGSGITVEHWSGGSRPHPMGQSPLGGVVTSHFELDYLPDPTDEKTRWALAFYREGLSLDRFNVAYATLSFFKILNIVANTGKKQKAWINAYYANFGSNNHRKFEIDQRIAELRGSGVTDIGVYLYESCRCAVAHAGTNPTVDPENPEDTERLTKDLPLIRAMAAHVIEKEFNIKSSYTVWDEHRYELAGFKDLLGVPVTNRLKAKDTTLTPRDVAAIGRICIGIKNRDAYPALANLVVQNANVADGKIQLTLTSEDHLIEVDLALDFPDERILFDIMHNPLRAKDDGSQRSAKQIASVFRFIDDCLGNGKLQIFNAATGDLLGRKDAYIPVNIVPGGGNLTQLIAKYEAEAETRPATAPRVP